MSLTLVASLAPESALYAAVGTDAALRLEALLQPEAEFSISFASDALTMTLGPYIVVTAGGGAGANGYWREDYMASSGAPGDGRIILWYW